MRDKIYILIRKIHTIFIYIVMPITLAITVEICLFFSLFSKSKSSPFLIGARIWGKFMAFITGVKVNVSGAENVPKDKAVVFAANHQSFVDDILALGYIPVNFRNVVAKNYYRIPVFSWAWNQAGYIPVDRENPLGFALVVKKVVDVIIRAGESVLIFPEATRSRTGKLGEFKHASLMPALMSGAPVIPLAISGTFDILPPSSWVIKPGKVNFSFGKPIYITSEAEYDQKIEEVRDTIAKML